MRASYQDLRATQMQKITVSSQDPALRTNEGLRFKGNQAERVMDALKENAMCESTPSALHAGTTHEKIMNLRPRHKALELDGDFRFKPKSTFEKFVDKVSINATNSIKTDDIFSKRLLQDKKPVLALKKNLEFKGQESIRSAIS